MLLNEYHVMYTVMCIMGWICCFLSEQCKEENLGQERKNPPRVKTRFHSSDSGNLCTISPFGPFGMIDSLLFFFVFISTTTRTIRFIPSTFS